MRNARTKCIFQIQLVLILANDIQLWRHDTDNNQLVNKKNENVKLSVDLSWAVPTETSTTTSTTTMIDQSTNPKRVYGLEGDDDDVTTNPKVVEEDLEIGDAGQTWTVTQVETTDAINTFYTFSINNHFLTGEKQITVQGT